MPLKTCLTLRSICSPAEQHSFVLNQLFSSQATGQRTQEEVCNAIHGTIRNSETNEATSDACQIVLRQAGVQGTGTITSTPSNLPTATPPKRLVQSQSSTSIANPSMSTGVMAGIITPVILVTLIAIALIIWIFIRRKRKSTSPPTTNNLPISPEQKPSFDDPQTIGKPEADSGAIFELPEAVTELPETTLINLSELEGDQQFIELPSAENEIVMKAQYKKSADLQQ